MRFSGEPILITGGAGGMGEAMARRFAGSGARVALCDLDPESVGAVADRLSAEGLEVIGVSADTTDEESMASAVKTTIGQFGGLHGLVTAAGIRMTAAGFDELDMEVWDRIHRVNTTGTYVAIRAAREALIASTGAIVTVSSVTARGARMRQSAYAVSKAAVLHLTRQVALELAAHGVRANTICPGVTLTPMIEQAAAAEFLLSSDASFITGTALYVDGGVSMLG